MGPPDALPLRRQAPCAARQPVDLVGHRADPSARARGRVRHLQRRRLAGPAAGAGAQSRRGLARPADQHRLGPDDGLGGASGARGAVDHGRRLHQRRAGGHPRGQGGGDADPRHPAHLREPDARVLGGPAAPGRAAGADRFQRRADPGPGGDLQTRGRPLPLLPRAAQGPLLSRQRLRDRPRARGLSSRGRRRRAATRRSGFLAGRRASARGSSCPSARRSGRRRSPRPSRAARC